MPPKEPALDDREPNEAPQLWLVDGFNVIHAGLVEGRERGRWWSGRARRRLLERVARFQAEGAEGNEIVVVFDGRHPVPETEAPQIQGTRVIFAESADDWLVARIRAAPRPAGLAVVTRDRRLAGRVRHRGAQVVKPRDFLARCPAPPDHQPSS